MSDEGSRTLPPTPRRLADARAQGRGPRSAVASAAFCVALSGALSLVAPLFSAEWSDLFNGAVRQLALGASDPPAMAASMFGLFWNPAPWLVVGIAWTASTLGAVAAASACGSLSISVAALSVKSARVAISSGLRRLMRPDVLGALMSAAAAVAIAWAAAAVAHTWSISILAAEDFRIAYLHAVAATTDLWRRAALAAIALAAADIFIQRRRFLREMRMTPREVKEERARTDGRPEVKARRRGVAARRARDVRIAAIKRATAVVTNPAHVAIALRYAPPAIDVPIVVARGADARAGVVRGAADAYGVPIVESPELARMLYAGVEVDEPIPEACYAAVAAVFAWIIRTRGALGGADAEDARAI